MNKHINIITINSEILRHKLYTQLHTVVICADIKYSCHTNCINMYT